MRRFTFLFFLPLALLALPGWAQEPGRDAALKPGDVFIPRENRPTNVNSNCVWCAATAVFLSAGYEPWRGVAERAPREGFHGSYITKVVKFCNDTNVPVTSQMHGDDKILRDAIANGTAAYIQIDGDSHAIVCVGIDDAGARILDNNPPLEVRAWSRAEFDRRWTRKACRPTVNLKAVPRWETREGLHYLFRGPRVAGCWNPETLVWWSWDGKSYTAAPPPWRNP